MDTTRNQEEICKVIVDEIADWLDKDLCTGDPLIRLKIAKRIEESLKGKMMIEHVESVSQVMTKLFLLIRQYRTGKEHPRYPF